MDTKIISAAYLKKGDKISYEEGKFREVHEVLVGLAYVEFILLDENGKPETYAHNYTKTCPLIVQA